MKYKTKTKFEVGQKYNRLTIIEKCQYDKYKNRLYKCQCDCGNIILVRGNALSSGNTKSCGCLAREIKKAKRLPDNRGVINHIILQYKRHAKDRNIEWNLTYEDVSKIIQEPCYYCGTEKSNLKITKNCKEGYRHNGIDRIDSNKDYNPKNVVACCKICNYAKSNMNIKNFQEWAIKIGKKAMAEQWSNA